MTTIDVKPHPDLDLAAWPLIVHPVSGSLLDAAKAVPADGRPWLNDGFTARMLTDGAVLRADDPLFAARAAASKADAAEETTAPEAEQPVTETDPAH